MNENTFLVKKTTHEVRTISDALPEEAWGSSQVLNDFRSPWGNYPTQKMLFKALYNNEYLFLRYEVIDSNVLIYHETGNKIDVAQSDRVEVFFRQDKKLSTYYCLEIDPLGKVLDYSASFYRKFDYQWQWPEGSLSTRGHTTDIGYQVEAVISLQSLRDLGILKDRIIEAGIYRGDCIKLPPSHGEMAEMNWVTWVDPKTEKPDFHIPASFAYLRLAQ